MLFESISENGFFYPTCLPALSASELARRLGAAGYNRGDTMTGIFTGRLQALGCLVGEGSVDDCTRILLGGSQQDVTSLLQRVKRIGVGEAPSSEVVR